MMFANKKSNDEDLLVLRSTDIVAIAEILCDFLMSRKQKLHCPFSSSRLLYDLLRKWDALYMDMGHGHGHRSRCNGFVTQIHSVNPP